MNHRQDRSLRLSLLGLATWLASAATAAPAAAHAPAPQAPQTLTGRWQGTVEEQVDGVGTVRYPVQWSFSGSDANLQLQVTGTAQLTVQGGRQLTAEVRADYSGQFSGGQLRMRSTRVESRIVELDRVIQGAEQQLVAELRGGSLSGRTGSDAEGFAQFTVTKAAAGGNPLAQPARQQQAPSGGAMVFEKLQIRDQGLGGAHSHSMLKPRGWQFQGGVHWTHNPDNFVNFAGELRGPNGVGLQFLPSLIVRYYTLNGQPTSPASRRGVDQRDGTIGRPVPESYGELAIDMLLPRLRPGATDVQLVAAERMTGAEQQLRQIIGGTLDAMQREATRGDQQAQMMGTPSSTQVFFVVERARLQYRLDGQLWEEELRYATIGTRMLTQATGMTTEMSGYSVHGLRSYRAPARQLDSQLPLLLTVANSLRETPAWSSAIAKMRNEIAKARARGRQIAFQQAQRAAAQSASESVSDMMMDSWRKRQDSMDRMQKAEIDAIHETHDFRGSDGQTWTVPNTWDHAWVNAGGEIVVTDDSSYQPGADPSLGGSGWQRLERVDPFRR